MTPKRKRSFSFDKKYSEKQFINAVAAVKNKTMKYKEASTLFYVLVTIIADRVKGRLIIDQSRPGTYNYSYIIIYILFNVVCLL